MIEEELLRAARLTNAILKAAFRDRIQALAQEVAADAVSAAAVEYLEQNGRTSAGVLKDAVLKALPQGSDVSPRTFSRRLADLENKGVVERIGAARGTQYQLTGLTG